MAYGVCQSSKAGCSLSYESDTMEQLGQLVLMINLWEPKGRSTRKLLKQLDRFKLVFQTTDYCWECGAPIVKNTQSTEGLARTDPEREKRYKLNGALNLKEELMTRILFPAREENL